MRELTDTFKELAVLYVCMLLVSASIFCWAEGVPYWTAFYWAGTTATSTGYGDISPKTTLGRIDAFALQHISIFMIAPLIIVRLIERVTEDRHQFTHDEQETIKRDIAEIKRLLASKD